MQARAQRPVSAPTLEQTASHLRGRGRPLSDSTREALEHASGRLFGHVRVHDDALGVALADAADARAVTIGGDIAIGSSGGGQGVLAHELAHAAGQSGVPAHGPLQVSTPGDAVEQSVSPGQVTP